MVLFYFMSSTIQSKFISFQNNEGKGEEDIRNNLIKKILGIFPITIFAVVPPFKIVLG